MLAGDLGFYVLAIIGHAAFWIALVNRLHGTGAPCWFVKTVTLSAYSFTVFGPLAFLVWAVPDRLDILGRLLGGELPWLLVCYLVLCVVIAAVLIPCWLWQRLLARPTPILRRQQTTAYDLGRELGRQASGTHLGHWITALPLNETLRLEVTEKTLEIAGLPQRLDGLAIAHLSDLHFTGRVSKSFFQEVIRLANELDADLVAVTGDLVEKTACVDWIPDTFGRLQARRGAYFVLGNHDARVDIVRLRRALVAAGLVDLGGRWQTLEVDGQSVFLAGNELPWFSPAPAVRNSAALAAAGLKIVLAHTPDQLDWARRHGFDLMLAGHTHGGQIVLPIIGPVASPSLYGVKYAAGTFYEPPTVLHVSRGVSGELPFRWNCTPEISRLILTTAKSDGRPSARLAASAHS